VNHLLTFPNLKIYNEANKH